MEGRRADYWAISGSLISLGISLFGITQFYLSGSLQHYVLLSGSIGEIYGILIDRISASISFVVITAGVLFIFYSVKYMSPENKEFPVHEGKGRFYGWMLIFTASTLAFITSSTMLGLLVFFEILSLSCWGVVGFYRTEEAKRAAFKAILVTNLGGMLGLFSATSIEYLYGGSISLYSLSSLPEWAKGAAIAGVIFAAFCKSSQFPFYSWLPDAMVAPTPASAFLHGAAMVEMGVYLLARTVQFSGGIPRWDFYLLCGLLIPTQIIAIVFYAAQKDAKRLLAYSTIAESSVMYAGVACAMLGYSHGIYASMYQLFNHAYAKGLAFLSAGVFGYAFGTLRMDKIRGLVKSSKLLAYSWTFSLLGLAGIPPFGVFFGKIAIINGVFLGGVSWPVYLIMGLILADSGIFTAISLRRIHEMCFSGEGEKIELSPWMTVPMAILFVMSVASPYIGILMLGQGVFRTFTSNLDGISRIFLANVIILGAASIVSSCRYLRIYGKKEIPYYSFLSVFIGSMVGIPFTNNWLSFLFLWELMTVSSYFLILYEYEHEEARKASWEYLVTMHFLDSIPLILGICLIHASNSSFNFSPIYKYRTEIAFLMLLGFSAKAGLFPIHFWLPKAHPEAPSPVSALLSGAMVEFGLYGSLKVLQCLGWSLPSWIPWTFISMALASMFFSMLAYYREKDLKKLLAWSTIDNMGWMFLALCSGLLIGASPSKVVSFYVLSHGLAKGAAFITSGAIIYSFGTRSLEEIKGAWNSDKLISGVLISSIFSLEGVPPFNLFFAKMGVLSLTLRLSPGIFVFAIFEWIFAFLLFLRVIHKYLLSSEKPKKVRERAYNVILSASCLVALSVFSQLIATFLWGVAP